MTIECTKLDITAAVKQTYGCLWHYKFQHILISVVAALPFCIAGMNGALSPVLSATSATLQVPEGYNLSFGILVLSTFFWLIPCIILWHRLYLLGPEHLIRRNLWALVSRTAYIISHSLVFIGMALIAATATTWGILYLRNLLEESMSAATITSVSQAEYMLYTAGIFIFFSLIAIASIRFSMAFSSQSIGKKLGFITSWKLTRRNTTSMLLSCILILIPLTLVSIFTLSAAKIFWQIDLIAGTAPSPDSAYYYILLAAPLLCLPIAGFCSLTSAFYRHCGCADYWDS